MDFTALKEDVSSISQALLITNVIKIPNVQTDLSVRKEIVSRSALTLSVLKGLFA